MFSDQAELELDIEMLVRIGFRPPKWEFKTNVPLSEITCANTRHLCDIVAFKDGRAVLAMERDGAGHNEAKQRGYDARKDLILQRHGIRIWRWWNSESVNARNGAGCVFRRDIKALFYAPHGALKSDYNKLCECTIKAR